MTGRPRVDRQLVLAQKRRVDRTSLERLAEVRGWTGGHRAPNRTVTFLTDDGVRLAASWLPGPGAAAPAVVIVHGFAAHRRKPAYAALADHLAATCNVLSIDLRGHGQSEGVCELGAQEWRDVSAAVAMLRARGQRRIVVIGLSLGGTATAHALSRGLSVDGAVLISSSARHWDLSSPGMQDLDRLWRSPVRRRVWQAVARFTLRDPAAIPPYPDPVDLVSGTTVPMLLVHGPDDAYFSMSHAEELLAAAGGPTVLWREPVGFGHAEDGVTPVFCHRLGDAVHRVVRDGRFPDD